MENFKKGGITKKEICNLTVFDVEVVSAPTLDFCVLTATAVSSLIESLH